MSWPEKIKTTRERWTASVLCAVALGVTALTGCSDSVEKCGGTIVFPDKGSRGEAIRIGGEPVWVIADMRRGAEGDTTLGRVEVNGQLELNQQLRDYIWGDETESIKTIINEVPVEVTVSDEEIILDCLDTSTLDA